MERMHMKEGGKSTKEVVIEVKKEAQPVKNEIKIKFSSKEPMGITMGMRGNEVVVTEVEPGGQANALPAGAIVTEVEGTSCVGKSKADVMAILKDLRGDGPNYQRHVSVTFDTSGQRRSSTSGTTPKSPRTPQGPVLKEVAFANNAKLGMSLQQQGGQVVVTAVDSMGPAAKGKIPVGAVIKEVGDDSVVGLTKDQVLAMITKAKKKGVVTPITFAYQK